MVGRPELGIGGTWAPFVVTQSSEGFEGMTKSVKPTMGYSQFKIIFFLLLFLEETKLCKPNYPVKVTIFFGMLRACIGSTIASKGIMDLLEMPVLVFSGK